MYKTLCRDTWTEKMERASEKFERIIHWNGISPKIFKKSNQPIRVMHAIMWMNRANWMKWNTYILFDYLRIVHSWNMVNEIIYANRNSMQSFQELLALWGTTRLSFATDAAGMIFWCRFYAGFSYRCRELFKHIYSIPFFWLYFSLVKMNINEVYSHTGWSNVFGKEKS